MKKTLLFILITITAIYTFGQDFSQGRKMAGGNVGLEFKTQKTDVPGSGTTTNGTSNVFIFNPFGGYFIIDGVAVGAGVTLATSSFKPDGQTGDLTSTQIAISPFGRYYHSSGFFGHVGFDLGSGKVKNDIGGNATETKTSIFGIDIGGGYAFFLNDNVAVEPMLLYESNSQKNKDTDVKDINSGIAFRIGFNIFL